MTVETSRENFTKTECDVKLSRAQSEYDRAVIASVQIKIILYRLLFLTYALIPT